MRHRCLRPAVVTVRLTVLSLLALALCVLSLPAYAAAPAPKGVTRTYYVAADEVTWNYAPSGRDEAMGMPFDAVDKSFTQSGPHRIGSIYKKAVYRQYTDGTFKTLVKRPPDQAYLGILGPILRGAVGDTIRVVFKNNATHPFGMHPHGVVYTKDSEGAAYSDEADSADMHQDNNGGCIAPGHTHTYIWKIEKQSGPGPNDPSSIMWLYHSHCDELRDVASGLFGFIIVTRRGMDRPDGSPRDVDKEFCTMFIAINENESWYIDDNINKYTTDPKGIRRDFPGFHAANGLVGTVANDGFASSNVKWSINGYIYGNMPMMVMKKGEHVRWYVATLGDFNNAHTPHWHGNTVMVNGQRTDVIAVTSAQMVTADMTPENPGIWLYHCHISDHMLAGMVARYEVTAH
jgi:FtsP/CotA-like multicopper oxidase with cupredoxin domain